MSDPLPTTPTRELDEESPQEALAREQPPQTVDPESQARATLLRGLARTGSLRFDELAKQLGVGEREDDWKARLWRLHNEDLVKVRWVGMTDPAPVEMRITDRGREWLATRDESAAGREPVAEEAPPTPPA